MPRFVLLLGSNIDPLRFMPAAGKALALRFDVQSTSGTYVGPAIRSVHSSERAPDPEFHNQAMVIETSESLRETRARLRTIEAELDRVRTDDTHAPRTIDIDIVGALDATGNLVAPIDEGLFQHHFVALPVTEVARHSRVEGDDRSMLEIATALGPPPAGFRRLASSITERSE